MIVLFQKLNIKSVDMVVCVYGVQDVVLPQQVDVIVSEWMVGLYCLCTVMCVIHCCMFMQSVCCWHIGQMGEVYVQNCVSEVGVVE